MAKGLEYRGIGPAGLIIPTPLYVDNRLLAQIILGEEAGNWPLVRRVFERQGMPPARATVCGLYYVPAVLKFLDRREGIAVMEQDYPQDGPDRFAP